MVSTRTHGMAAAQVVFVLPFLLFGCPAIRAAAAGVDFDDILGLHLAWGENTVPILQAMCAAPKRFAVRQLAGSLVDYQKAMRYWWVNLRKSTPEIDYDERRVYFVSSNTHSLVNMWSGYALRKHDTLLDYIRSVSDDGLLAEYNDIQAKGVPGSRENFFYYALKKYLQARGPEASRERAEEEHAVGIRRITSEGGGFELDAQVIHLDQVNPDWIDPRLCVPDIELLKRSGALIVNGFVKDVIQELPMEFAVEAQKLIGISLEGSVG